MMKKEELEMQLAALHAASFAWTLTCCDRHQQEAEDILQTTYLKVLDGRARFHGRSSLKTWLFAVIRRTALDRRRRRWWRGVLHDRWQAADLPRPSEATPEERLQGAERRARIERALAVISTRQRQVLELVFFHDLTIQEASVVLAVGLGTARVHYERGKRALLEQLREERAHAA